MFLVVLDPVELGVPLAAATDVVMEPVLTAEVVLPTSEDTSDRIEAASEEPPGTSESADVTSALIDEASDDASVIVDTAEETALSIDEARDEASVTVDTAEETTLSMDETREEASRAEVVVVDWAAALTARPARATRKRMMRL